MSKIDEIVDDAKNNLTEKLTIDCIVPNPAKVGMYMKFIYDKVS